MEYNSSYISPPQQINTDSVGKTAFTYKKNQQKLQLQIEGEIRGILSVNK